MFKNCGKIRKDIVAYLYDEITKENKENIRNHIKSCETCRLFFQKTENILKTTKSFELESLSKPDWEKIYSKINNKIYQTKPPIMSRPTLKYLVPSLAAIFLILSVFIVKYIMEKRDEALMIKNLEICENLELLENFELASYLNKIDLFDD